MPDGKVKDGAGAGMITKDETSSANHTQPTTATSDKAANIKERKTIRHVKRFVPMDWTVSKRL